MNIQTKAAQATKNRRGVMMAPLLVAVTVAAIVVIPIVRWCMAFINGTENINAQLEMKSIIQDYYARISAASYEDMQETIAAKGTTWTEDVGGRYTLKVETSEAGKFENALCNLDETAGAYDQACMKADITLVSNADPSRTVGMQVTRIATPNPLAELADLIEAEGEKFANYYTKTEADAQYACPWDYHLVSGKCVPCPAPSGDKQYRSGNCTIGTCSEGYRANSAKNGCEKIPCSGRTQLVGNSCQACSISTDEYYLYSSGCAKATCPEGTVPNADKTACLKQVTFFRVPGQLISPGSGDCGSADYIFTSEGVMVGEGSGACGKLYKVNQPWSYECRGCGGGTINHAQGNTRIIEKCYEGRDRATACAGIDPTKTNQLLNMRSLHIITESNKDDALRWYAVAACGEYDYNKPYYELQQCKSNIMQNYNAIANQWASKDRFCMYRTHQSDVSSAIVCGW